MFFFSSRRRHTRYIGDWSSDVCSSDLPLDEESRELVEVSKRNADRLVRLVNDILDVSKIEAGRLELSPAPIEVEPLCAERSEERRVGKECRRWGWAA